MLYCNRSPESYAQVILSATPPPVLNMVQIRTLGACGEMGEINRPNFFIYLYRFSGTSHCAALRRAGGAGPGTSDSRRSPGETRGRLHTQPGLRHDDANASPHPRSYLRHLQQSQSVSQSVMLPPRP